MPRMGGLEQIGVMAMPQPTVFTGSASRHGCHTGWGTDDAAPVPRYN